ncbi:MAG: hypothetical protein AB7V42_02295 [Thermoleophilia bacterium]
MLARRRYEVVIVGQAGAVAAQRGVVGSYRSENEARRVAEEERLRIERAAPEQAANYRVQVLRHGTLVHEEQPDANAKGARPPWWSPRTERTTEALKALREPTPEGPVPDWVLSRFGAAPGEADPQGD